MRTFYASRLSGIKKDRIPAKRARAFVFMNLLPVSCVQLASAMPANGSTLLYHLFAIWAFRSEILLEQNQYQSDRAERRASERTEKHPVLEISYRRSYCGENAYIY